MITAKIVENNILENIFYQYSSMTARWDELKQHC